MPKFAELKWEFMKAGCYLIKEGSNHERWYSPITDAKFEMSRHNNEEVRKDMEMNFEERQEFLKNVKEEFL